MLEEFVAARFDNHGQRVVTGQRLMQASSDIFLGWLHATSAIDGKQSDYFARQLKDWKGSAEIDQMTPVEMRSTGSCPAGRSHEPSAQRRPGRDRLRPRRRRQRRPRAPRVLGRPAEQNRRDYQQLGNAAKTGGVDVRPGL